MKSHRNPWTSALMSTGLISLAPNLLLLAFPDVGGAKDKSWFLSAGQALAAGSLLADVFLHTLPESTEDDNGGFWVLVGFTIFLVLDMVVRSVDDDDPHGHGHGKAASNTNNGEKTKDTQDKKTLPSSSSSSWAVFKSSKVLLNLTADALHNFTDGLAIGVSYAQQASSSRGSVVTVSILLHEIPHEVGDYAILLQAGCSKYQAICAQGGTALAAMMGTIVGVWAATQPAWSNCIVFVTGGGFVYLAAASILPQVLAETGATWRLRVAQLLAFLVGMAFLYTSTLLEDHGHHHGHHHHHHGGHHHAHHDHDHMEHDSHDHGHDHHSDDL